MGYTPDLVQFFLTGRSQTYDITWKKCNTGSRRGLQHETNQESLNKPNVAFVWNESYWHRGPNQSFDLFKSCACNFLQYLGLGLTLSLKSIPFHQSPTGCSFCQWERTCHISLTARSHPTNTPWWSPSLCRAAGADVAGQQNLHYCCISCIWPDKNFWSLRLPTWHLHRY